MHKNTKKNNENQNKIAKLSFYKEESNIPKK
jgi:hypothetical protein